MLLGDGTKLVFSQPDGSTGTSRRVFLTQIVDPFGNAMTLTYDVLLRLVAVTDAIGQVTTIFYSNPTDVHKITKVIDPFGRFATFDYDASGRLVKITDVIGLTSQFSYDPGSDFINALITPYGTTSFAKGESGTTRSLETTYPDGTKDRVEFNQSTSLGIPASVPANQVPGGMATANEYICYRNTYYWSRTAYAKTYPDYTKARIYHWLHTPDLTSASRIVESAKEPLENRVWNDYAGQSAPYAVGANSRPTHIGRVLDDGTTQLFTYAYDQFGHLTNSVDPVGRTLSYLYDTNNIDLLEIRQTRAGRNELLSKATYNSQHLPLTRTGAAGRTTTYTYNARGQMLTETDPKNETFTCTYNTNGYLVVADGPLPGTNDVDTATYDAYGRIRIKTDVNGYTLTLDYDNLDRVTRITYPDATVMQFTYDRLDLVAIQDRAGRQTLLDYNNLRQMTKKTDPMGRTTLFEWCQCGDIKSLTDPMGRTTSWLTDEQGRRSAKQYGDGSQVKYFYENTTSRLREVIDEKQQATLYAYNLDNTLKSVAYANAAVPTPSVSFTYDPDYERVASMTDGTGSTLYSYIPITGTPALGASRLASVDGPLPNDTITYGYDELGRPTHRAINGVDSAMTYDAAGRVVGATNALGTFAYTYDGNSGRFVSQSFPNGQTEAVSYGGYLQDFMLQQISYAVGATPISQLVYGRDLPADRITTWSQQAGAQPPSIFDFGYDAANQLLSATLTNAGVLVNQFAYSYDPAGNRLTEQAGATNYVATYNALNQLSTTTAPGASRTNEWNVANRLVGVNAGNQRTEFTYDGQSRMVGIRQLLNGAEVSHRLFLWNGSRISEERDTNGAVTKRFFPQGVQFETGTNAGAFFYTRDHLRSIRELTDSRGNVRARYAYDPFGRRTKVSGDVDADFGFAGMFWAAEANLSLTHFRAYDPELGRWLSRDPLGDAEVKEGPNLYAYVGNEQVNHTDPEGLCFSSLCGCLSSPASATMCVQAGIIAEKTVEAVGPEIVPAVENAEAAVETCVESDAPGVVIELGDRLMHLGADYRAANIPDELANWAQLGSYLPSWPLDMIWLDREFFSIAQELAAKGGLDFDEAWRVIALVVEFDPELWPH